MGRMSIPGVVLSTTNIESPRCRGAFGSVLAVIAAHMKEIDRKVLAGGEADMAEEPPRERLFDVMMRRLEMLAPLDHTGTRTVARSPPSGLSPNMISPPCERAMSRAIARPSPLPPSS